MVRFNVNTRGGINHKIMLVQLVRAAFLLNWFTGGAEFDFCHSGNIFFSRPINDVLVGRPT